MNLFDTFAKYLFMAWDLIQIKASTLFYSTKIKKEQKSNVS